MAYLYQSIERRILDLAVEKYGENIILRIHDAIITKEPIDKQELQAYILVQTGFNITYDDKQL